MDLEQILSRLAVALGIGLLFGLERGWKTREVTPGSRAAGIRTFAISGLLGGIVAALAKATGSGEGAGLVLGFGFAVYATVTAVFERDANRAADSYSATTIVAAMLTFMLGAYAVIGDMRVASAAAVAATGILAAREEIHGWVARITWPELSSALVLLAMTVIVLPVLPDTTVGPSGGVNPREVWLIAIVLAAVSFLGYGAVKLLGAERGVLLAAFAGGLVSSTAVTMSSARRAAAGEGVPRLLAAGVAVASAVSFLRVIAIVAVMNPGLLVLIAPPLVVATLAAAAYATGAVYWQGDAKGGAPRPVEFKNPFSFWPVVGFAIFLGVIILLGRVIGKAFGASGALIVAAAVGLADVDSISVSMARLVPEPLSAFGASAAILAAVASNMVSKLAIAAAVGRGHFAGGVAAMTAACWLTAAIALWATLALGAG
jgi:uncharacterized membrane protein (DUF4010 family)